MKQVEGSKIWLPKESSDRLIGKDFDILYERVDSFKYDYSVEDKLTLKEFKEGFCIDADLTYPWIEFTLCSNSNEKEENGNIKQVERYHDKEEVRRRLRLFVLKIATMIYFGKRMGFKIGNNKSGSKGGIRSYMNYYVFIPEALIIKKYADDEEILDPVKLAPEFNLQVDSTIAYDHSNEIRYKLEVVDEKHLPDVEKMMEFVESRVWENIKWKDTDGE